jgi:hypothetical protein
MAKTANRQPKPCRNPGCGKLTFSGECLECRREQRRGLAQVCRHCHEKIFEPLSMHLDKCEAYRTWSGPAQTKETHS